MSYSLNPEGQVVLTMNKEDYEFLMLGFGMVLGKSFLGGYPPALVEFLNRLNVGNPLYTPYRMGEK
jgi:hypothetical protein